MRIIPLQTGKTKISVNFILCVCVNSILLVISIRFTLFFEHSGPRKSLNSSVKVKVIGKSLAKFYFAWRDITIAEAAIKSIRIQPKLTTKLTKLVLTPEI